MTNRVAERRKELGLTQGQLAKAANVGQHTISDIETGKHLPRVDVAIEIARALFTSVENLFFVEDKANDFGN